MSFSVILYVWQNIEVVKMDLQYSKLLSVKKKYVKANDRLRYEIELYRKMDRVQAYARDRGYRPVGPGDIDVLVVGDAGK